MVNIERVTHKIFAAAHVKFLEEEFPFAKLVNPDDISAVMNERLGVVGGIGIAGGTPNFARMEISKGATIMPQTSQNDLSMGSSANDEEYLTSREGENLDSAVDSEIVDNR